MRVPNKEANKMEFTYERDNGRVKPIRRTIEVSPTRDDYIQFITGKVDNKIWPKEAYEKAEATIKWLFDNGFLLEESFDEDDDFQDYLREAYQDTVEWPYEPDLDDRDD